MTKHERRQEKRAVCAPTLEPQGRLVATEARQFVRHLDFVIDSSFVIRHSDFVISGWWPLTFLKFAQQLLPHVVVLPSPRVI
jgi:hypothetical protein